MTHVAIDYTTGAWPGAGVARYTRSLVAALLAVAPEHTYTLFYGGAGLPRRTPEYAELRRLRAAYPVLRVRELPGSARLLGVLWNRLRVPLPADLLTGRPAVLHAPDFVLPPVARARTVVTVHDLSFLVLPEVADPGNRAYLTRAVPRAVRRATCVVAVSQATRCDVITRLGVPPGRVVAVPNGVDARFRPGDAKIAAADAAAAARLGLPARFLLHVGTLEPRKNLVRLIAAYARLVADRGDAGHDLVLAGRRGWMDGAIFAAAAAAGLRDRIRFLDYVPDRDLPALYRRATALVYPSLYEGFGLPVLEAMACGTPVVVSRTPALVELVADAGVTVPPTDEAALAAAMARIVAEPDLRAALRAAGPARAGGYTWAAAARRMAAVYRVVATAPRSVGRGTGNAAC